MSTALSERVLTEIRELPAKFPQPRSAVMPALDLAQEELGHLTPQAMSEVAEALELDPGYVEGVATFYSLFHLQPIGKHRFYVCTNLSCMLRGSGEIVEHVKQAIGVREPGEISADGLFSYEEVECLGACEFAPMMRFDHRYHYDLTPEKIDEVVAQSRSPHPAPSAPTSPASGEVSPHDSPTKEFTSPQRGGGAGGSGYGGAGVAPKAPEGATRKPRAPRKKKADG